jgi:hypothetical protein
MPIPFETLENGDQKAVWLCKDRWQVSMQIGTDGDLAYFGIEDLKTESGGHEVALGVGKDGRPFLQVCSGEEFESVDLIKFVQAVKAIM